MKSSAFICAAAGLALCLAAPVPARAQQQDFSKVTIKTTHVAGNVHMLEGAGGNIAVSVGDDGLLMVDDQFAPLAEKIKTALQELHQAEVKFLINTHWHGDHTGGNGFFGQKATIVAHASVRQRLQDKSDTPKEGLPKVTFQESLSLHLNGEEIKVIHLQPGHTDGDSMVHFTKSGVVHMGDQFVNRRFPFIDLGSGGDVAGYIKNVKRALEYIPEGTKIIPGHGALATRADFQEFSEMLNETSRIVSKAVAEGKTLEQVKVAGMPEKYKDWGSGFINTSRWLEITYNNLTKK